RDVTWCGSLQGIDGNILLPEGCRGRSSIRFLGGKRYRDRFVTLRQGEFEANRDIGYWLIRQPVGEFLLDFDDFRPGTESLLVTHGSLRPTRGTKVPRERGHVPRVSPRHLGLIP